MKVERNFERREPGDRTFYLQARSGPVTTSVALEKQQVQVLAERVEELLDEHRVDHAELVGRVLVLRPV
ncbi:MAG: DUF3090 family protein [Nitrospiraceae bacterium]|nr:DUF3090 family protein [Nitrospiraceae bacterium]